MASSPNVSDSNEEDGSLIDKVDTPENTSSSEDELAAPHSALSHRFRKSSSHVSAGPRFGEKSREGSAIAVLVSGPKRPWEYQPFDGDKTVDCVLQEIESQDGNVRFKIEFETGRKEVVSFDTLMQLKNGQDSLIAFQNQGDGSSSSVATQNDDEFDTGDMSTRGKRFRRPAAADGFVNTIYADFGSDDSQAESASKRRRTSGNSKSLKQRSAGPSREHKTLSGWNQASTEVTDSENDLLSAPKPRRSGRQSRSNQSKFSEGNSKESESDEIDDSDGDEDIIVSDIQKRRRARGSRLVSKKGRPSTDKVVQDSKRPEPSRRSGRDRGAARNLKEHEEDEVEYADEIPSKPGIAKGVVTKENFKPLPKSSDFRQAHSLLCDVCHNAPDRGPLVYCQGCSTSIHQGCLGGRSVRLHRVTKVGEGDFVLQCRRCIGAATKHDSSVPSLDACQECGKQGLSCAPFSQKRTTKQEERLRDENGGRDPITEVDKDLLNNSANVLFRCRGCHCAYHFEHLPPLTDESENPEDIVALRDERLYEYRPDFFCADCVGTKDDKVERLVAWRPADGVVYKDKETIDSFSHDQIEYLIKWEDKSYLKSTWMKGSWTYGVTTTSMRKAFYNQEDAENEFPIFTADEAIPEEYNIMEIVLDVEYVGNFKPKSLEHGMENLQKIEQVLVKFQGLNYVDSVWDDPPEVENTGRWEAFEAAAHEFFRGKFFEHDSAKAMAKRLKDFRSEEFEPLEEQPEGFGDEDRNLILKPYQLDGMNFLRFNFYQLKNVILADDMGLGKTIQVIAFISSMVKQHPECWPFLIVTPNSTCPNWRREIKLWAPELRVVAYYGGKAAREIAKEYELYPQGTKGLVAHVVITSYEAPVDKDGGSNFFRSVKWAGLIVDEGQRLKNDKSLLYKALTSLRTPFQCLLTGTPLQNNKRELWNLLAFLDKEKDAEALDEQYSELTEENLPEIHALIKPHMLRRKKVEVLDLPPMAQVIIPTSMSVLQKELCRSIIEKNPVLISSILAKDDGKIHAKDRGNLNNIMMQLRKVLAHPFMYSARIEEIGTSPDDELRILIEASSKMQLLQVMLPKLKERGHRVLIFSQFLDQLDLLEEFLHGLGLYYTRIDGKLGALEKQKRIDSFNFKSSELFACLLSTRAGGVGINLATADTVIIMDPDFNPHQDMQALSRAHRIGQKNKVLVFQLMTRGTVEEKIIQIGRSKMALDQALIESIKSKDDPSDVDLATILKHGAKKLFDNDNKDDQILYDSASVDKLLDRSQLESKKTDDAPTSESQFSFARVWENNKGELTADIEEDPDAQTNLPESVWVSILAKRLEDANAGDGQNGEVLGRGRRAKQNIVYDEPNFEIDEGGTPQKKARRKKNMVDDDDEFGGKPSSPEHESEEDGDPEDPHDLSLEDRSRRKSGLAQGQQFQSYVKGSKPNNPTARSTFTVNNAVHAHNPSPASRGVTSSNGYTNPDYVTTYAHPNAPPSSSVILNQPYTQRGQADHLATIRNPLQRPDFTVNRRPAPSQHPPILPPGHLNDLQICRRRCGLDHLHHTSRCPPTMSTSTIRILLDRMRADSQKNHALYIQLRQILADRNQRSLQAPGRTNAR